jgi:dATP pyrophosphohydrolase
MRAPFQILAIPYRKHPALEFCVLRRADNDQWQFVAGGGEDAETPLEAAAREISEETGIQANRITELVSMAYVPADVISEYHRKHWSPNTFVLPEYHFAFECGSGITLSGEHLGCEWLSYHDAMSRLTWDSNKTALYELNCRLSAGR